MQTNLLPELKSSLFYVDKQHQLGLSNGAIFAVPIPEEYEAAGAELQAAVEQALQEAEENGVSRRGKEATPWLLKRVGELTAGKSLLSSKWLHVPFRFTVFIVITDVALIKNTARVGTYIQSYLCLSCSRNTILRWSDSCCLFKFGQRRRQCAPCKTIDTAAPNSPEVYSMDSVRL